MNHLQESKEVQEEDLRKPCGESNYFLPANGKVPSLSSAVKTDTEENGTVGVIMKVDATQNYEPKV